MKFPSVKTLLIAGLIVGASHTAFAQAQGMSFGADEAGASTPVGPSPVAGVLKEGIKLYGEKNYLEAAQKFYTVTKSPSPAATIDKQEAQYRLAMTLYHLKLYQSALFYYTEITSGTNGGGETHPFFLNGTLNGLADLAKVLKEDSQLTNNLLAYQKYVKDIPKGFKDRFGYLVGRRLTQDGRFEDALGFLALVQPGSVDYAKAQYIEGVANAAIGDYHKAVGNFKNSLRWLSDKRQKTSLSEEEKRFLELGYLALARVYYSAGKLQVSIKYYSKIDRASENWPVALLESSWAYFRLNDYNKALGNLQTVNSPFFSDRYFPQAPNLAAFIYFYNCRYDRVRGLVDDFLFEYEPLKQKLDSMILTFGGGETYDKSGNKINVKADLESGFNWLINAKTKQIDSNKQLQRVVSAALSNKEIRNSLSFIVSLDSELDALSQLPKSFQESEFGKFLKQTIQQRILDSKLDMGTLIVNRLSEVDNEIGSLIINAKQFLYEVDRAERGELQAEIAANGKKVAKAEIKADKIKTNSEELVWDFDGEYWRDELGYYVVSIVSQCKR